MRRVVGSREVAATLLGVALLVAGCQEVVVESLPVSAIEIAPASITLLEREEVAVSAVLRGPGGEVLGGRSIQWSTLDAGVADLPLASEGRLLGVASGSTRLQALSDGVQGTADVTVLQGPTLGVAPSTVALGGRLGTDTELQTTVGITNTGNGVLSGLTALVTEAPWLQSGWSSSTAPSELRLTARLDALAPGTHQATVEVRSPVAGNSPQTLLVTLEVQDALPSIGLAPGSLAFGANAGSFEPAAQGIQVTNTGGGTLDALQVQVVLEGGTPVSWLAASLGRARAPTTLSLEASARMLAAGTYRARVRVTSAVATPSSAEVDVTFNVSAGGLVHGLQVALSGEPP